MYIQFTIVNGAHGYSCKYVLNEIVQYIQANMPHKHITFLTHVCALCGLFRKDFDCKLQTYISWGFEEFLVFLFVGIHVVGLTSVPINHPLASLSALHPQLTTLQQLSFTFTFTFTLRKKSFHLPLHLMPLHIQLLYSSGSSVYTRLLSNYFHFLVSQVQTILAVETGEQIDPVVR